VPIVLLDTPGGTYWRGWQRFVDEEVAGNGMIAPADRSLYCITDDVEEAVGEVERFYRNYHSLRYVGDRLVLRLRATPTDEEVEALGADFADICVRGTIERARPFPPEISSRDHLALPRLALRFNRRSMGRLRQLIDRCNTLASAPAEGAKPPTVAEGDAVVEREDADVDAP
jgi:hypothetical protein